MIVALALWPGLILDRAEDSVDEQLAATNQDTRGAGAAMTDFNSPDIDYAGLSPVIALTAGICVVLMVGLILDQAGSRAPTDDIAVLAATAGLCIWQWNEQEDLVAGALRLDAFGLAVGLIACLWRRSR